MKENTDGVKVGMYCSSRVGSDRYPYKVIAVTEKTFTVAELRPGKNRVQWPDQDFEIDPNPDPNAPGIVVKFSKSKRRPGFKGNDYYFSKPSTMKEDLGNLYYLDPSF